MFHATRKAPQTASDVGNMLRISETEVMSNFIAKEFMAALLLEMQHKMTGAENEIIEEAPSLYKILRHRIETCLPHLKVSKPLMAFICVLSKGSPGNAVLWASVIAAMAAADNRTEIDIDVLTRHFPMGFPTEASMSAAWDAQKVGSGNLLDASTSWN